MGFYPVAPGSNQYVVGSPCVDKAVINLENGKTFIMTAENLSVQNIYIKEMILNGKKLDRCSITHDEIIKGGELKFVMQSTPNKNWAVSDNSLPYSMTR